MNKNFCELERRELKSPIDVLNAGLPDVYWFGWAFGWFDSRWLRDIGWLFMN